jgi:hypothetical protein
MIVLDILHNIFEILPELILGAGPFCVFKGMGTGKDSGKLLFKKLYTDGGLSITEDANSLDLSASGGSSDPIDICEIAFGTATTPGITSSTNNVALFVVCEPTKSIHSMSVFGGPNTVNYNQHSYTNNDSTLIVGARNTYVFSGSKNSLIVGGYGNKLFGPGGKNHIDTTSISGYKQFFYCSYQSAMISSFYSKIDSGCYNTSISSYYICTKRSNRAFVLGSKSYLYGGANTSDGVAILGGKDGKGYGKSYSFKSYDSLILNSGVISESCNSVVFGKNNTICNSRNSTTLSGTNNYIRNGYLSAIMNGYGHKIYHDGNYKVCNSMILNGYKNYITCQKFYSQSISNSLIVHGDYNVINGLENNVILNGTSNTIKHKPPFGLSKNNVIINGANLCIRSTCNSVLSAKNGYVEGPNNSVLLSITEATSTDKHVVGVDNSVILNSTIGNYYVNLPGGFRTRIASCGRNNSIISVTKGTASVLIGNFVATDRICNSGIITLQGTASISGTVSNSFILNFNDSYICGPTISINLPFSRTTLSSVIMGNCSKILNACESVIIAGKQNRIETANRSAIIGGYNNIINGFRIADVTPNAGWKTNYDSVILGGHNNEINSKTTNKTPLVIIGGSFSAICGTFSSVPNLDAQKFSVWNASTGITNNGLNGQITTISQITVCKGIVINWF